MLNIPSEVITLLKKGNTKKNFRIHFPNGEFDDITNKNIVDGSLSLSESLCSQSTLQFGSTEGSNLQFETVGIGNLIGCKIECCIEIFCDQSVEDSVYKEDIDHYVYQIPYGVFYVESSEKQADMTHRKIKAYTPNIYVGLDYIDPGYLASLVAPWIKNEKVYISPSVLFNLFFPSSITATEDLEIEDISSDIVIPGTNYQSPFQWGYTEAEGYVLTPRVTEPSATTGITQKNELTGAVEVKGNMKEYYTRLNTFVDKLKEEIPSLDVSYSKTEFLYPEISYNVPATFIRRSGTRKYVTQLGTGALHFPHIKYSNYKKQIIDADSYSIYNIGMCYLNNSTDAYFGDYMYEFKGNLSVEGSIYKDTKPYAKCVIPTKLSIPTKELEFNSTYFGYMNPYVTGFAAVCNNKIYFLVTGSTNNTNNKRPIQIFDWSNLNDEHLVLYDSAVEGIYSLTVVNNEIYVLLFSRSSTTRIGIYKLDTETFGFTEFDRTASSYLSGVGARNQIFSYNNELYDFGMVGTSPSHFGISKYDPQQESHWLRISDYYLPGGIDIYSITTTSATIFNNTLYLIVSDYDSGTLIGYILTYNFLTSTWNLYEDSNYTYDTHCKLCVYDNHLYLLGVGPTVWTSFMIWNDQNHEWNIIGDEMPGLVLPWQFHDSGAVEYNGMMYMISTSNTSYGQQRFSRTYTTERGWFDYHHAYFNAEDCIRSVKYGEGTIIPINDIPNLEFKRSVRGTKQRKESTFNTSGGETARANVSRNEYNINTDDIKNLDIANLLSAYMGINGTFGHFDRYGKFIALNINDHFDDVGNAGTLIPSEYSDLWYGDYTTRPIGRIQCFYRLQITPEDPNIQPYEDEGYAEYDLVPNFNNKDYRCYDISENFFIKNKVYTEEEEVLLILHAIGDNINKVMFTPLNLESIGLPHIEVGDVFTVNLADGSSFKTVLMSRDLKGVLSLRDSFKSSDDSADQTITPNTGGISNETSGGQYVIGSNSSSSSFSSARVNSINGMTGDVWLNSDDIGGGGGTGTVTSVGLQGTSPITISGTNPITSSGTMTIAHANSGVTAGTYNQVTVDARGHITAGSNVHIPTFTYTENTMNLTIN